MENTRLQRYSRHVYFDADEREYVALCSEFPHVSAFGETPTEALAELNVALEGALEVHYDEGWPVPEPLAPPEPEALPSGKFLTRLPKTLHAQLARTARAEGVSLNTMVITLLAKGLAVRQAHKPFADAPAVFQRMFTFANSAHGSGGPTVPSTLNLVHQRTHSEWRDDTNDVGDADWLAPRVTRVAANEEKAMVN